jgi:hypothetical protein
MPTRDGPPPSRVLESRVVAEARVVLEEWRRAERLLSLLPPEAPERGDVAEQVELLRALYQRLTSTADGVATRLAASQKTIDRSVRLMDRVTARYAIDPTAQLVDDEG